MGIYAVIEGVPPQISITILTLSIDTVRQNSAIAYMNNSKF